MKTLEDSYPALAAALVILQWKQSAGQASACSGEAPSQSLSCSAAVRRNIQLCSSCLSLPRLTDCFLFLMPKYRSGLSSLGWWMSYRLQLVSVGGDRYTDGYGQLSMWGCRLRKDKLWRKIRSVDISNFRGCDENGTNGWETSTSTKGYLPSVFVHKEGFSVGRSYSIPVTVDSVHQPMVSCGSMWILPCILWNAHDHKKVGRSNFSDFFTSWGPAEKKGCLHGLNYSRTSAGFDTSPALGPHRAKLCSEFLIQLS